jgi:molybdopterin-guanine dinucleotide biosynthesis protein A
MSPVSPADLGGVVLSGGGAARFQGADKASMEVGGATLLEHALGALADVPEVVVVGEQRVTNRPVSFVLEDPVGGGPAAGLLAGLAGFPRPPRLTVVLAVDMPMVTTDTVRRLQAACHADGALLLDEDGRRQFLCAVYRTEALRTAAPAYEQHRGLSMRALVSELDLAEVPALAWESRDVDTWEDLTALRERLDG